MANIAVIQARMSSRRLPGKVAADLGGEPLLARVIARAQASRLVDDVVVAVADEPGREVIEQIAAKSQSATFPGSPSDVLDRTYRAAQSANADVVVRITSDDPFKDPAIIDDVLSTLLDDPDTDYASNTLTPTFPEGLDVECMRFAALERAWAEAKKPSEREHVTPFIWKHPERFVLRNVRSIRDYSHLRWTIDYREDLLFARAVYEQLAPETLFGMNAVLELLAEHPELESINSGHQRNAGYLASVLDEAPGRTEEQA
jgi:spore coat polysaccharide biosynthesis protein SpsF